MATLAQLLELPGLGLRLVQAGASGVELSWVSTTELLDLGGYLEGGEIVLTTGLALGHDDPRWRDFVASLSRARVAAIGFGVGVNHTRIPAPLIAAAGDYRLALVEVPPPTPFIAVSKAVAGLIQADELRAAHRALQIHQRLLDGARGSQSQAEVLASIAQATDRQLALVDADGGRIASTAGFAAAVAGRASREEIPLEVGGGIRLEIAAGEPLGPEGRAVIAAGAMVLGLGVSGASGEEQRERERWARLTSGLLSGALPPQALSVLQEEGAPPAAVRAIAVRGAAEDLSAWRSGARAGVDRLVTAAEIDETPGIALAWQLCPVPAATAESPGAGEHRAEHAAAAASVDASVRPLDRALRTIARHGLDAVVGRAVAPAEAALSARSARLRLGSLPQLEALYAAPRVPRVIWADRDAPFLDAALLGGDAQRLSDAVLAPLLAEQDADALLETTRAVLAHGGQRGPAAAALGIHRNTLRDRLRRVEQLTERSMDVADDRTELWLALRVQESLPTPTASPREPQF